MEFATFWNGWTEGNQRMRRFLLVVIAIIWPPLLALAFLVGTQYGLTAAHRYINPVTLRYGFYIELALFYVAAAMELRSRWRASEG